MNKYWKRIKYPPPKVIFVDVDGTLYDSVLNHALIKWCRDRKAEGFKLVLWSARGEDYAKRCAKRFDIVDLFDHIIDKPGYIVDDLGWSWIKYTKVVKRF